MSDREPVICFGQQPAGFFPKRFLVSKIKTARRLQEEVGGRIVFFFHDSDHDPRETTTKMLHRNQDRLDTLNFRFANKLQKKYAPLYCKRVEPGWQENTARQLPNYVGEELVSLFESIAADSVAEFCLEVYRGMGLLEGVEVARSSDPAFRRQAIEVEDFFVDLPLEGETVRTRYSDGRFLLHQGGSSFREVEAGGFEKEQVSPARDTRLRWMQSVLRCTHYVAGASEIKYMKVEETPEIEFVERDFISRLDEAYVGE